MPREILPEEELKKSIWEFWEKNPCGSAPHQLTHPFLNGVRVDTPEFYEKIDSLRYSEHPYLASSFEFNLHAGEKILEVGCGLGSDLCQFAKNGAIVTGVDIAQIAVETTLRRLKDIGLPREVMKADATRLPFTNEAFDFVYCNGVLHHLPSPQKGIEEIHRVLRPGKKAIVMLYNLHSLHFYWWTLALQGVFRFGLLKYRGDISKLISNSTDGYGNPLSRLYTRRHIRQMFCMFSSLTIDTYYIPYSLLFPKLGKYIRRESTPHWFRSICDNLAKYIGFHHIIKMVK